MECNVWAFLPYFKPVKFPFMGEEVKFVLTINFLKFKIQASFKSQSFKVLLDCHDLNIEHDQEWKCENLKALSIYFWLGFVVPQLLHSISVYNIMKRTFSLGV